MVLSNIFWRGKMKQDIKAVTKQIDVLPMVKHYITELKLYEIFDKLMPQKSNEDIAPAQVLCMNIICASRPLYRFSEWLAVYLDSNQTDDKS